MSSAMITPLATRISNNAGMACTRAMAEGECSPQGTLERVGQGVPASLKTSGQARCEVGTQDDADAVGDVEKPDSQSASTSQQMSTVDADEDVVATADQTPGDPHIDDAGGERVAAHRGEALDDGLSQAGAILDRPRCLGDRIQRPQHPGSHGLDGSRDDERGDDPQGADAEAADGCSHHRCDPAHRPKSCVARGSLFGGQGGVEQPDSGGPGETAEAEERRVGDGPDRERVHEAQAKGHQQPYPGQTGEAYYPSRVVAVDHRPAGKSDEQRWCRAGEEHPRQGAACVVFEHGDDEGHLGDPDRQGSQERGTPQLANFGMSKDGPGGVDTDIVAAHLRRCLKAQSKLSLRFVIRGPVDRDSCQRQSP